MTGKTPDIEIELIDRIPPMVALGLLTLGVIAGISVMLVMERRAQSER